MSVYHIAHKLKYRVTLEIEALQDFDPHQIDWNKVLELQGSELSLIHISEPTRQEASRMPSSA